MSSLPQKPPVDSRKVKKLLEKYDPREAYEILAAQIILANERTRDTLPPSRVQAEACKKSESAAMEGSSYPARKKPATGSNNGEKPLCPRKRLPYARTWFGENPQR